MRRIRKLIVHCSATPPNMHEDWSAEQWVKEIDQWHRARGWSGIGYHYVIARDGSVAAGRPEWKAGAHTRGHNRDSIGICLIGGKGSSATDKFSENYTPEQDKALRRLLDELQRKYPRARIYGHNQFARKACPGFNVQEWLTGAKPSPLRSTTIQAASLAGIAQIAGGLMSAAGGLSREAQLLLIALAGITLLALLWIVRERLRKWAEGDVR